MTSSREQLEVEPLARSRCGSTNLFQSLSFKEATGTRGAIDARSCQKRLPIGRDNLDRTKIRSYSETLQNIGRAKEPSCRNEDPSLVCPVTLPSVSCETISTTAGALPKFTTTRLDRKLPTFVVDCTSSLLAPWPLLYCEPRIIGDIVDLGGPAENRLIGFQSNVAFHIRQVTPIQQRANHMVDLAQAFCRDSH